MTEYILTDAQATDIRSATPTDATGGGSLLISGERSDQTNVIRMLLKWDNLSSIPSSYRVTSAVVRLEFDYDFSSNARYKRFYRMLVPWTVAGATWRVRSTGVDWIDYGGFNAADCDQSEIGATELPAGSFAAYYYWTLDNGVIQAMVRGSLPNYGFMLKTDTENDDGVRFDTVPLQKILTINAVPAAKRVIMF